MDKDTKRLLKEREKLVSKLCKEIADIGSGKTRTKLK